MFWHQYKSYVSLTSMYNMIHGIEGNIFVLCYVVLPIMIIEQYNQYQITRNAYQNVSIKIVSNVNLTISWNN